MIVIQLCILTLALLFSKTTSQSNANFLNAEDAIKESNNFKNQVYNLVTALFTILLIVCYSLYAGQYSVFSETLIALILTSILAILTIFLICILMLLRIPSTHKLAILKTKLAVRQVLKVFLISLTISFIANRILKLFSEKTSLITQYCLTVVITIGMLLIIYNTIRYEEKFEKDSLTNTLERQLGLLKLAHKIYTRIPFFKLIVKSYNRIPLDKFFEGQGKDLDYYKLLKAIDKHHEAIYSAYLEEYVDYVHKKTVFNLSFIGLVGLIIRVNSFLNQSRPYNKIIQFLPLTGIFMTSLCAVATETNNLWFGIFNKIANSDNQSDSIMKVFSNSNASPLWTTMLLTGLCTKTLYDLRQGYLKELTPKTEEPLVLTKEQILEKAKKESVKAYSSSRATWATPFCLLTSYVVFYNLYLDPSLLIHLTIIYQTFNPLSIMIFIKDILVDNWVVIRPFCPFFKFSFYTALLKPPDSSSHQGILKSALSDLIKDNFLRLMYEDLLNYNILSIVPFYKTTLNKIEEYELNSRSWNILRHILGTMGLINVDYKVNRNIIFENIRTSYWKGTDLSLTKSATKAWYNAKRFNKVASYMNFEKNFVIKLALSFLYFFQNVSEVLGDHVKISDESLAPQKKKELIS